MWSVIQAKMMRYVYTLVKLVCQSYACIDEVAKFVTGGEVTQLQGISLRRHKGMRQGEARAEKAQWSKPRKADGQLCWWPCRRSRPYWIGYNSRCTMVLV